MSDQSDEIHEIVNRLGEEAMKFAQEQEGKETEDGFLDIWLQPKIPSYQTGISYHTQKIMENMMILFRKWAGHKTWEDAEAAIAATTPGATRALLPVFHAAFADGVQLGHGVGHVIRKFKWFNEEEQLWTNEGFRQESDLLMMSLLSDYDTAEFFEKHFQGATQGLLESLGFTMLPPELANRKIWDAWGMIARGSFTHLMVSGYELGVKWKDNETLAAIIEETDAKEEGR